MRMLKKIAVGALGAVVVGLIAIQLAPYGRAHTNPPVRKEPAWDSARTHELAARACYDCHSNQTEWPWYSQVAPVSWLIQHDVDEGRRKVNFSEFDLPQRDARDSAEQVQRGKMPQAYYVVLHPAANLTSAEREDLIRGLQATFPRTR